MNAVFQTPELADAYEVVIDPERPWLNLMVGAGAKIPEIAVHPGQPPPGKATITIGAGSDVTGGIILWGECPSVTIGSYCFIQDAHICCGDRGQIVIGSETVFAVRCNLNARHAGEIHIGSRCLVSVAVSFTTDDMHAIRDRNSGLRINTRGGKAVVGDNVWLGANVKIRNGANVGSGSVVGEDTRVASKTPPNALICNERSIKIIRENIEWSHEDSA